MAGSSEREPLLPPIKPDQELSRGTKRAIVAASLLTGFLSTLDLTIVATCIPTISSELKSADQEAWIGTAYLWSNVTFTPLYGRLSDILGRRSAYLQAQWLFTLGTLFCGLAPNFTSLAIARFIAGMGGGGMQTVASVLMADLFPPETRAFYQGLTFATFGAGMGLGGPVGGVLTQYFGWRAAFYAQIPIAAVAIAIVAIYVPQGNVAGYSRENLRQIDFGGSFTLLVSIGALLQLLSRSGSSTPILSDPFLLSMSILFPLAFLLFIYVELRLAPKPVLPLSLLSRRTPLCVGIIAGVIAIVNFNMLYHLPTIFEIVFQQPLSVAGAHLLPNSVAMTISAPIMGLVIKKTRRYKWATVMCCAGPVLAMAMIVHMKEDSNWAVQWLSVLPMGAGFSGLLTLTLIAMLNSVDSKLSEPPDPFWFPRHQVASRLIKAESEIATATGFVFVWRSLGQVFGVGLSGAVYQASLTHELNERFDSPKIIDKLRHASKAIHDLSPANQAIARKAFGVALRNTFLFGLGGALVVFITSLAIPNRPLKEEGEAKVAVRRGSFDEA